MLRKFSIYSFLFVFSLMLTTCSWASIVASADFDDVDSGSVTAGDLDSHTTGAAWWLNTGRSDASYQVAGDGGGLGDKALMLDDTSSAGSEQQFSSMNLDSSVDLTGLGDDTLDVSFQTTTTRSGGVRSLIYRLVDSSNNIGIDIEWWEGGELVVNGVTKDVDDFGEAKIATGSWNSTASEIQSASISIASDSTFTMTWSGKNASANYNGTLDNTVTDIHKLRVYSGGTGTGNKGLYMDDIKFEVIPEPASSILFALVGLALLIRCRRQYC